MLDNEPRKRLSLPLVTDVESDSAESAQLNIALEKIGRRFDAINIAIQLAQRRQVFRRLL